MIGTGDFGNLLLKKAPPEATRSHLGVIGAGTHRSRGLLATHEHHEEELEHTPRDKANMSSLSTLPFLPTLLYSVVLVVAAVMGKPEHHQHHHETPTHRDAPLNPEFSLKAILLASCSPSEKPGWARDSGDSLHLGEWTIPGHRHQMQMVPAPSRGWWWHSTVGLGKSIRRNQWSERGRRGTLPELKELQPDGLGRLLGGDRCLLFWVFKRKLKKGKRRLSQTETQWFSSLPLALELRPYLSTDLG